MGRLMPLVAIIKTHISDRLSVRRHRRRIIRAFAVGERLYLAILQRELVNLAIEWIVFVIRMQIRGKDQVRAVGSPGGAAAAEGS